MCVCVSLGCVFVCMPSVCFKHAFCTFVYVFMCVSVCVYGAAVHEYKW